MYIEHNHTFDSIKPAQRERERERETEREGGRERERQTDRPWGGGGGRAGEGWDGGDNGSCHQQRLASTEGAHDLPCWMYLRAPFSLSPESVRCAAAHVRLC